MSWEHDTPFKKTPQELMNADFPEHELKKLRDLLASSETVPMVEMTSLEKVEFESRFNDPAFGLPLAIIGDFVIYKKRT